MEIEIKSNYSPFMINISYIHSSIRNNQHYQCIHQYSGEMVIICSLIVTFTYNPLIFRPDNLWEWRIYNIEIITIQNVQWKSLPIPNNQHYNGSQQDSGEMALFLHCSTFLHEIFWVFRPEYFEIEIQIIYIRT